MAESASTIQADFDRLALISAGDWNHNDYYQDFLLRHVPQPCRTALEVGCGTGSFTRLLAGRSESVLALDLSPQMIRLARECSRRFPNIRYEVADALNSELSAEAFDCIATIATLHHLPLGLMLPKMKAALKVNGVLLILDLCEAEGLRDRLTSLLALPVKVGLRLMRTGRMRAPREVRRAWAEHGLHDSYPTMTEVRRACADVLPGAMVKKHLLWRYSIIWKKKG
ncbi:MAG TPA: class I SAM-dependent methyltransferase [Pyrinomonadaceae bacterium]|jgi:ubiquinone/menaquinone biosynthesis C-methylase UbiE